MICIRARTSNIASIWKAFYRSKPFVSKQRISWNLKWKVNPSLSKSHFSPHQLDLGSTICPLHIIIQKKPGKLELLHTGQFEYCPLLKLWKLGTFFSQTCKIHSGRISTSMCLHEANGDICFFYAIISKKSKFPAMLLKTQLLQFTLSEEFSNIFWLWSPNSFFQWMQY